MIPAKRQGNWQELLVPSEWAGLTLEQLFKKTWEAPKKLTHLIRTGKMVLVNQKAADWTRPLQKGDKLFINFYEGLVDEITPTYMDIDPLYEDDHLLIVNKPAGMDTHPNEPEQTNTLLNGVAFYLQSMGQPAWVRHIHRLDRDTTGAILFAKHPLASAVLDRMLEQRLIKRTYIALVQGILKKKKGTINESIGRDRHHATRRRVSTTGQTAITHFQLIETYPKQDFSLVKCWLDTGRTHQIRVHFSHLGHPLLGDTLYGGKPTVPRQALHAVKMDFIHPFYQDSIVVTAPLLDKPAIFPENALLIHLAKE
jgi:23S rRNA pseudouridine1911/1915/1917 synthase